MHSSDPRPVAVGSPPAVARPGRVIVLDDDVEYGRFMGDVARRAGFEPTITEDVTTFLASADESHDLVILDLVLPGMDGVELIHTLAGRGCTSEMILVSGLDARVIESASAVATSMGLAVRGHLQKPFRAAELRALLLRAPSHPSAIRGPLPVANCTSADLLRGTRAGELVAYFQPQVGVEDRRWIGAEALVRWQHPSLGFLLPDRFLHAASDLPTSLALTYDVLTQATRAWSSVRARTARDLTISINIPAEILGVADFPVRAGEVVAAAGLPASAVIFEVTEVGLPADATAALETLTRLRVHGFGLSIDDFGTGHSTLERLHRVPFTELKIDRQFVRGISGDPWARTIAAQSIALAHALGLRTVAEGVEDEAGLEWLRDAGCDIAQGFFISRPVDMAGLDAWSEDWFCLKAIKPAVSA